ncbi:hypothetical protein PN462_19280 [Spirulina sp. CS-785/01]|uniref:hypothetical protein n=1 Tax=Spirulina sp. CS-785/01 TaxID=3021716 RepID=UPI002331348C|nr:hypothetical protein [Spirulina sp. CS-785/01]MDB9315266.1 hypothetical protein [Spirulina sp. CS-785/01]
MNLKDNSGTVLLFINDLKIHHVYILDKEIVKFGGYVGWIHTEGLLSELEFIKNNL